MPTSRHGCEYYGPEFYCALFNNWPMGFYPPHVFTNDARRHGIDILRPDVNVSAAKCTVEDGAMRIGLGYVKGVGEAGGRAVEEARASGGPSDRCSTSSNAPGCDARHVSPRTVTPRRMS